MVISIPKSLFALTGIVGIFFVNSLLIFDKLNELDDEFQGPNHWLRSSPSRQRHLAVVADQLKRKRHTKETASATPRELFEKIHPSTDTKRVKDFLDSMRDRDFEKRQQQRSDIPYDIFNCPSEAPPKGYPLAWKALELLDHWGVDDTNLPKTPIYQGLCVFDWNTQQKTAELYRRMELPFVVVNHPDVMETAERWNSYGYLDSLLGNTPYRNDHSDTNHQMFFRTLTPALQKEAKLTLPPGWEPPIDTRELSFQEWLEKAQALEEPGVDQTQEEHWYFRFNAYRQVNKFIYDEMPFFDPLKHEEYQAKDDPKAFLTVDASQHRGINCRFGMKGVIAEMHFDPTRNFVILLGGQRRYILAHPDQCKSLDLYDRDHPSGRHSKVNFSNRTAQEASSLASAMVNEVVLQPGDILYLPTSWFHFIVSLNINFQCNARSGVSDENTHFIDECGMGFE